MGGCAASKLGGGGEEGDAVALCRRRKRFLKLAVARRYALADAHAAYGLSLLGVATAIDIFVSRHSSPATPILITLPPASPPHHCCSHSEEKPPANGSSPSSSSCSESGSEEVEESREAGEEMRYGYFYAGVAAATPPPPEPAGGGFGWDFFNPFDGILGGMNRSLEEDLRVIREKEGIPELEEVEEEERKRGEVVDEEVRNGEVARLEEEDVAAAVVEKKRVEVGVEKGLTVTETPVRERELLEALRDVEDQFIRAYDSGKEVSRMLEANRVQFHSGFDEIKENSSKIIHAITWHRSPSQSSSYRSHPASSSNSTSWTESKSDLFNDYGGMESGSHSQTLGRLYAWEKKLYEEVKAGESTYQEYLQKCLQLRNQDARGADSRALDKTRAAVKDLYTRIWVALRSADTISKRIQKLRDDELQPQLMELLQGLMTNWKIMLESHDTQKQILAEVKLFSCPAYGKFCNDSQRLATVKLEAELRNWRTCFGTYIEAQRSYAEALDGWLSKFIIPDIEYYQHGRSSRPSYGVGDPPLVVICRDWLTLLRKLPDKPVSYAMKTFIKDVRLLWAKQGQEQQHKRKVDSLAKEVDRKVFSLQKAENKILEYKLSELKPEPDVRQRMEYLARKKDLLETLRKKLDVEKLKHRDCTQETERATLNGFKMGLSNIFESLAEFSNDALKLYNELLRYNQKIKSELLTHS